MNTYELLRSGQRHVQCVFPCLAETQECEPRRRRMLLGMMLDRVRDQGRVARCIYGPLLRQGVDPNLVLATFQSQAAVEEMLVRLRAEVSETRCWLGALTLLRCLVQEHFDNQEAPLRRGVGHFYGTDPEVIAPTYSSLQSSAAVGSSAAWPTRLPGSKRAASENARAAASS